MIRRPPRSTLFPTRRSSDLDQRTRRPDGLAEPGREVPGLRLAEGGQGTLAVAPERGGHLRLDARLDDHHLGALAEAPHELDRLRPPDVEARRTDVLRPPPRP